LLYWAGNDFWTRRATLHVRGWMGRCGGVVGWSLNFLVLALVAAGLGATEVAGAALTTAKLLFAGSLLLLFSSTVIRANRRRPTI
jgi:uncharacterized membrane protein YtjA (UPF0391 family)